MRDQVSDDEDEREFAELQRAALTLPKPAIKRRRTKRRRTSKRADAFVRVPLWWAERAAEVTRSPTMFVCLWLLHLSWKAKSTKCPIVGSMTAVPIAGPSERP